MNNKEDENALTSANALNPDIHNANEAKEDSNTPKNDIQKLIKELQERISFLEKENRIKDEQILALEYKLKSFNSSNKNVPLNSINNNEFKIPNKVSQCQSHNDLTHKNLHAIQTSENEFNNYTHNDKSSIRSFLPDNAVSFTNQLDASMLSNSFLHDISLTPSRKRMNKTELSNISVNLKINDLEIEELCDDEMENFLDKIRNTKVENDKPLIEFKKETFMSFNNVQSSPKNKNVTPPLSNIKVNVGAKKMAKDFNKIMKYNIENKIKVRSTSMIPQPKVVERKYIKKNDIEVNKNRISGMNTSKLKMASKRPSANTSVVSRNSSVNKKDASKMNISGFDVKDEIKRTNKYTPNFVKNCKNNCVKSKENNVESKSSKILFSKNKLNSNGINNTKKI